MAVNLSWNTKTQIASGNVGCYAGGDNNVYTFKLYATATLSGTTASLKIEYTVRANDDWGGYQSYSGPYEYLYVDGTQRSAVQVSDVWPRYTEITLATYTKTLTASNGSFGTTSAEGRWVRNGTSGYAPKDLNISATGITLPQISGATESYYYSGSAWVRLNTKEIFGYDGTKWNLIKF